MKYLIILYIFMFSCYLCNAKIGKQNTKFKLRKQMKLHKTRRLSGGTCDYPTPGDSTSSGYGCSAMCDSGYGYNTQSDCEGPTDYYGATCCFWTTGGGGGGGNNDMVCDFYPGEDSSDAGVDCLTYDNQDDCEDEDCRWTSDGGGGGGGGGYGGSNTCDGYSCSQDSTISCMSDDDCNGCVDIGAGSYACADDDSISCYTDDDCADGGGGCDASDCDDDRYEEYSASAQSGCTDGCSTPAACENGADGNSCQNGGSATGVKTGTCGCSCASGYSGANCQTADACTNGANGQACQNGGTATGTTGSCGCNCLAGYSGNNCESADQCTAAANGQACQNGGTVTGTTGSCGCQCPIGFGGDNCERCAYAYSGDNCENFDGVDPDYYESSDAEPDPLPDSDWETQDVACGDGNFVSLNAEGEFLCKSCTEAGQGKTAFLAEFNSKRGAGQGSGVYHGKCCVNGHHKVCQQLLKTYKQNCDDSDKGHTPDRECPAV